MNEFAIFKTILAPLPHTIVFYRVIRKFVFMIQPSYNSSSNNLVELCEFVKWCKNVLYI